jgi:hypothetical protein
MIGLMLPEIDLLVAPSSEVIIFSPRATVEREAEMVKMRKRWSRPLKNVGSIQHVEGQLGLRTSLEELPVPIESASRIFILADVGAPNPALADACTVTTILQIIDILFARGHSAFMPIIPEIRDPITMKYCTFAKISDFVDSTSVCAQILAMVAYQPQILSVLEDIVSENGGKEFCIRGVEEYLEPSAPMPSRLSFFQAWAMASICGDVVLGWSKPFDDSATRDQLDHQGSALERGVSRIFRKPTGVGAESHVPAMTHWEQSQVDRISRRINSGTLAQWEMNPPDKYRARRWVVGQDKLVVVSHSVAVAEHAAAAKPTDSASSSSQGRLLRKAAAASSPGASS